MKAEPAQAPATPAQIEADLYPMERIAGEILAFTQADPADVWRRLCLEMEGTGYNVIRECQRFGVTPHRFDQHMIDFYQKSDGFIYETLVESRRPERVAKWHGVVRFIADHLSGDNGQNPLPAQTKILMYGDSVGSDSIYLTRLGYDVYYHDYESYCSQFANWRFAQRGLTIQPFKSDEAARFDFIVCLEVAEHAPDPAALIRELGGLLKDDGYCLFSEAFGLQQANFPTHLRENAALEGKTPAMFKAAGMHLYWRDENFKPMVFTRQQKRAPWVYRRASVRRFLRRIVEATGVRRVLR